MLSKNKRLEKQMKENKKKWEKSLKEMEKLNLPKGEKYNGAKIA
jgi:hypothetical protein